MSGAGLPSAEGSELGASTAASDAQAAAQIEASARPEVRLEAGRLSDHELAAVSVALAAINAASRAQADERALLEGTSADASGWSDAVHRLPRMHAARVRATASAWQFSHR